MSEPTAGSAGASIFVNWFQPQTRRSFPLKEISLALYFALGCTGFAMRIASLWLSPQLLLYLGLLALVSIGLILAAYAHNAYIRATYALVFSASALFLQSTEAVLGDHLTYDLFITLLGSSGAADEAIEQFGPALMTAAPAALALLLGVSLPERRALRFQPIFWAGPIAAITFLSVLLFWRGGEGARGLPSAATPTAYLSLYLYEQATASVEPRKAVALDHRSAPIAGDIVLIIDESVLGTYLDTISPGGVRSGLAQPRPGVAIYDYGLAASISHCSVATNVTLRYGGTRTDYQRINGTMPSIWQYARRAGLRTVYIDGQRTGGRLHGLMTAEELRDINEFIQFDNVPVVSRDMAAADVLATRIGNGVPELIIVNKVGAHFPVHDKYPSEYLRYRPTLTRGRFQNITDTGSRDGFGGSQQDWVRYRNSYRNTLLWNVGAFFDRLFARADLSTATLIYTSDHGQDLHEHGRQGVNTHCSPDPNPEEGMVPLVVIQGTGATSADWSRNIARNRNRSSHYQIFPTLLDLMGYDQRGVAVIYGNSLLQPSTDPMTFNILFHARLGRSPVWKQIRTSQEPERGVAFAQRRLQKS